MADTSGANAEWLPSVEVGTGVHPHPPGTQVATTDLNHPSEPLKRSLRHNPIRAVGMAVAVLVRVLVGAGGVLVAVGGVPVNVGVGEPCGAVASYRWLKLAPCTNVSYPPNAYRYPFNCAFA